MDDSPHDPAFIPAPGSYHWTPRLQREFLEAFATNGSVKISAAKVGMSPGAAYQLKQRPEGAAFRLGCAAALLIARGRLVDELLDRAIWGHDELTTVYREEDRSLYKRRRIDSRLGLAMLARLDRMVETRARAGEEMLAQVIAGDWPGFLSLFDAAEAARTSIDAGTASGDAPEDAEAGPAASEAPGMSAALALWLAGRDNRANPLATLWRGTAIANEVTQFSAISDADPEHADAEGPTPEEEADAMTVWHDDATGELRTNFPPPDDFIGIEEGQFGHDDYERTLDAEEEIAWEAALARVYAPLRKAGEAARRAFFALPDPANDPALEGGKARKSASG
ncbi:hypothetical protein GGC65_001032 [Sphingopyxis sp. OAS728]|uniref:hypothetical protein n=1 Tax=Sphingopyxis sp. OAS728 TaxID=2663823 RepID=UPI00178913D5|nr:hypothetical protein [Sphingopyxis sp. OAS728]MBE1526576.1 hypothetical protein [Sphingopyxis sp. OAS728]